MLQVAFVDTIAIAREELVTQIARTPEQIHEAKQLRHRVYCEERGFEAGQGNVEEDEFDAVSRHVLVRSHFTGEVYGTVRVILSGKASSPVEFPIEHLCGMSVLASLPRPLTGEVSRFALTCDRTGLSPAASALMRLCLFRGVIQIASEEGLTHLCALMEKTLLRLLRSTAIHFEVAGPAVEHRGTRYPSTWNIGEGLSRMQHENYAVRSFITAEGAYWPEDRDQARLAA